MHSTNMMILIALAPAFAEGSFATQQAKPTALSRMALPQVAPTRMRLPPAYGFSPAFAPEFAPSFAEGGAKKPSGGFVSSYSSYSAPAPPPSSAMNTAGLTPEQVAFLERQNSARGGAMSAPAPSPVSGGGGSASGLTPEQEAFLARKRGEVGMEGGLDTHGRPRGGGGAAPAAPVPVAAPAASPASGEFAGMTQDQINFIKRKRGEIGMEGGLDTHGRPRHLDAQESPNVFGILAMGLLGFTCGAVTFAILRFRRRTSDVFREPFLTA